VSSPTAVILAAGLGRRLGEHTTALPKALIDLHGKTLLERSLTALAAAGFQRACIVTGHCAESIDEMIAARNFGLETVTRFNPDYATANNIVSFLTVADIVEQGCVLLNSDIVFDRSIAVDVASAGPGTWLVVDSDEPLGAEEMKVTLDGEGRVTRVNKVLDPAQSVGEYIGITRFDADGGRKCIDSARQLVAAGQRDLYYEHAIDAVAVELGARIIPTRRRLWTEIDDEADYQRGLREAGQLDAAAS
jgi:L-glutamine-phosphate cytidylyltransferase